MTAESDYDTVEQEALGAALKLQWQPKRSVVFDVSPAASIGAHDADMRSVTLMGVFPRYELQNSDVIASNLQEITLPEIRR